MATNSPDRTRRQILGWGGAGLAVGVIGYLGSFPENGEPLAQSLPPSPKTRTAPPPAELPPTPFGPIHRDLFSPHLGSEFTFKHNADATAACKLVEVGPATVMKTAKGTFVAFTLLFEGRKGFLPDGGSCHVSHPQLTEMEFFLSPVGNGKKKCLLEACFTLRA
jgi:hypothetical protein